MKIINRIKPKLWAIKMLFVWRYRLKYWEWDTFKAAWRLKKFLVD